VVACFQTEATLIDEGYELDTLSLHGWQKHFNYRIEISSKQIESTRVKLKLEAQALSSTNISTLPATSSQPSYSASLGKLKQHLLVVDNDDIVGSTLVKVNSNSRAQLLNLDELTGIKALPSCDVVNHLGLDLVAGAGEGCEGAHRGEDVTVFGVGDADEDVVYRESVIVLLSPAEGVSLLLTAS
jgi:hypothetical protein